MISLDLHSAQSILCIGAHADDIEIGCGGLILKMLKARPDLRVHWVVLSGCETRAKEAKRSAESFLSEAGDSTIEVLEFRDRYFPYQGELIKNYFVDLQHRVEPDVVMTHRREDMHQDHRLVNELTWNSFRNHLILEYEIPKYEGDLGNPNIFVPLKKELCQRKVDTILGSFASQNEKPWFTEDTFWSLLRIRGLEANSPTRYAEGLYCRKAMI